MSIETEHRDKQPDTRTDIVLSHEPAPWSAIRDLSVRLDISEQLLVSLDRLDQALIAELLIAGQPELARKAACDGDGFDQDFPVLRPFLSNIREHSIHEHEPIVLGFRKLVRTLTAIGPSAETESEEEQRDILRHQAINLRNRARNCFSGLEHPSSRQIQFASERSQTFLLEAQRLETIVFLSKELTLPVTEVRKAGRTDHILMDELIRAGRSGLAKRVATDPDGFNRTFPEIRSGLKRILANKNIPDTQIAIFRASLARLDE